MTLASPAHIVQFTPCKMVLASDQIGNNNAAKLLKSRPKSSDENSPNQTKRSILTTIYWWTRAQECVIEAVPFWLFWGIIVSKAVLIMPPNCRKNEMADRRTGGWEDMDFACYWSKMTSEGAEHKTILECRGRMKESPLGILMYVTSFLRRYQAAQQH
jgi:hypothetical protein